MSIEWITLLIFGSMVIVMFLGLPVAFATGVVGIIFTAIFQGPEAVNIVPTRIFGLMTNSPLTTSWMNPSSGRACNSASVQSLFGVSTVACIAAR